VCRRTCPSNCRDACRHSNALTALSLFSVCAPPGWAPAHSLAHELAPRGSAQHGMLRCPFVLSVPFRLLTVPPRSPAAGLVQPACRLPGWAARHMRLLLSRPRHPRDVRVIGVGVASILVVCAHRRSVACSLLVAYVCEFPLFGGRALTSWAWTCDFGRAACGRVATGLRVGRGPRRSDGCRSPWVRPG
jgi:hypothetical protein